MNLQSALFLFSMLQSILLAIVLLFQIRGNALANRCLATLLIVFSFILGENFLYFGEFYTRYPFTIYLSTPFWFLIPPLLFFYVTLLVDDHLKFKWLMLLHLSPLAVSIFRLIPFYNLQEEIKLAIVGQQHACGEISAEAVMFMVQGSIYFWMCYRYLRRHQLRNDNSKENSPKSHVWLRFLIFLLITYVIADFLSAVYLASTRQSTFNFSYISLGTFTVLIHAIGYWAIIEPERLFPASLMYRIKYRTSRLQLNDLKKAAKKIEDFMTSNKPFLNNDLKLRDLAALVNMSESHLSQIFSQHFQTNFYDFINDYRIMEAQQRLADPLYKHWTILSIGFEVGFNSKASFYRAFKRFTKTTPTKYLKIIASKGTH